MNEILVKHKSLSLESYIIKRNETHVRTLYIVVVMQSILHFGQHFSRCTFDILVRRPNEEVILYRCKNDHCLYNTSRLVLSFCNTSRSLAILSELTRSWHVLISVTLSFKILRKRQITVEDNAVRNLGDVHQWTSFHLTNIEPLLQRWSKLT